MQLLTHGGQESMATCSCQSPRVDHEPGNGHLMYLILRGKGGRRFTEVYALLLESQFQQGGDQQGIEVEGDAHFGMAKQMQAFLRAFQESEAQLHLPALSVQQNDLKSGQIQSIGQNQVSFLAHIERNQTIDGTTCGVGQPYSLVGDVMEQIPYRAGQIERQPFHPLADLWGAALVSFSLDCSPSS